MRADTPGVFLASDPERFAVVILADAGLTEGFRAGPLQLGQVNHRAVHQDDLGLDPVRPVAGITVQFRHHQVKFFRAIELGGEVDQALLVLGEQDGRLSDRLRVGGDDRSGQGKEGKQREAGLTGYVGHK